MQKMQKWAKEKGLELSVHATGIHSYENKWKDYDCILVGPQVRYVIPDMKKKVTIPVCQIEPFDYAIQDVDKILRLAYSLTEEQKG